MRIRFLKTPKNDSRQVQNDSQTQTSFFKKMTKNDHLKKIDVIQTPVRQLNSTHVYHQYTIKVPANKRNGLQDFLKTKGVPSMIYYPVPLNEQKAFKHIIKKHESDLPVTKKLCDTVISLPIHTEMNEEQLEYICKSVIAFFMQK